MTQLSNQISRTAETALETKDVVVDGISCTLEKRVCQNGCKKEFWVMHHSTAQHARSDCTFVCNVSIDDIPDHIMRRYDQYAIHNQDGLDFEKLAYAKQIFTKTNNRTKPKKPDKPKPISKEDDPGYQRQCRKWLTAISRARKLIDNKVKLPRFRESVAEIANAVVTNKKNFSIKCFSAMVGLDRKTLQGWIHVKCDIINKIENYDGNFLAARKTRDFVRLNPYEKIDLNLVFAEEKERCKLNQSERHRKVLNIVNFAKSESHGSSRTEVSGKIKIYRMKIRIKCVS
jgi:hypothetical protein